MPPGTRQGRSATPGLLLIALLVGAAIAIVFAEEIGRALTPRYAFVVTFQDAQGLEPGADVWLAGQPVGRVTDVALVPPGRGPAPVAARVELPRKHQPRVRHDAEFRLGTARVMGDPVVMIQPGTPAAPIVAPGDTVHAHARVRPESLLERTLALRGSIDSLFAEAGTLLTRAQARSPDALAMGRELSTTRAAFDDLLERYRGGPLANFLNEPELRGALARARRDMDEVQRRAGERAAAFAEAPPGEAVEALAQRSDLLAERLGALRALVDETDGFRARWEADPTLLNTLEATRIQLDSLIAETLRRPWRYFF